jgi:hypothetical protein
MGFAAGALEAPGFVVSLEVFSLLPDAGVSVPFAGDSVPLDVPCLPESLVPSLSAADGVLVREGAAASSTSSITKAASKTAGSGFAAPSPASFELRSWLGFFVGRARRAGD